jgi:hypothetical protein
MKNLFSLFIIAVFSLAMPAWAGNFDAAAQPTSASVFKEAATSPACPTAGKYFNLSQVSQADCCKGHKGVCGCRAGKIVCCDGTVSPDCTCHADSGIEN